MMKQVNAWIGMIVILLTGAFAQTSSITYQGFVKEGGSPANGTFNMVFRLFAVETGGTALQSSPATGTFAVEVFNGSFTQELSFNASRFTGADRFLEIEVNGTILSPRIKITSVPYSIFSQRTRGISVDGDGNIGMGTTTPTSSLHIAAPIPVLTLQDSDSSSQQVGYISLRDNAGAERGYIGFGSTATPHAYFVNNRVGGNIILGTLGGNPRLTVASGGFVGVGTSSPQAPLHVKGNAGVFNVEGTDHCYIQFYPDGFAAGRKAHIGFPSATSTDIVLANQTGGAFLSVATNGGVGIGTRTPNRRLTVWDTLSVEASPGFMPILGIPRPGNVTYRVSMFIDPSGDGVVSGDRKSFREVNPEDPATDIWYVCIEGPEAAMYVRGTASLVNGRAVIELPSHFRTLASETGMTVQLTPLSADSKGLAVVRKSLNGVEVVELASGSGSYEFDWEVKAVRKRYEDYRVIRPWDEFMPADEDRDRAWRERLQAIQKRPPP